MSVPGVVVAAATVASTPAASGAAALQPRGQSVVIPDLGLQLPADFFDGTFERRWALLRGPDGARDLFRSIWGRRQVNLHARRQGFKAYEFGIPKPKFDPEPGEDGEALAGRALRRNLTLVQNHVHRSYAPLARYMQRASDYFGLPGGMNSYTTPPGSTGFAYHFDPSDAFILQVQGSKAWELCGRRLPDPYGFSNLTYNQVPPEHPDVHHCETVELHEGDAIYLPIGLIHRAAATSTGTSVHLTMSLNRQFCSSVAMLLNVAEQINPSKESGFSQRPFVAWMNAAAADVSSPPAGPGAGGGSSALAELHDVPKPLLCFRDGSRGAPGEGGGGKGKGGSEARQRRRWGPPCSLTDGFFHPQYTLRGGTPGASESTAEVLGGVGGAEELREMLDEVLLDEFVASMRRTVTTLQAHPSASSSVLRLGVRVENKPEPVVGNLRPSQVLAGLAPLLSAEHCRRAILAWRNFVARQREEYEVIIASAVGVDHIDMSGRSVSDEEGIDEALGCDADDDADVCSNPGAADENDGNDDAAAVGDEGTLAFSLGYPEERGAWPWAEQDGPDKGSLPTTSGLAGVRSNVDSPIAVADDDTSVIGAARSASRASKAGAGTEAEAGRRFFADCCAGDGGASAKAQLRCANETAPPLRLGQVIESPKTRVLIVTYATPHVHSFARYSLAINANWAKRFGHSFVIDTRDRADEAGVDVKNAKVLVKHFWVSRAGLSETWLLWIGADAIFTDFDVEGDDEVKRGDVLRRLIQEHGQNPETQVIITRDPHGRAGNSLSLFNADVILLRRTRWTAAFLQRWWDDPRMKEGRTDQEVLELLYIEDVMGAASKFVLLPPLTLNSDSLSIIAGPPRRQPVVHLGGHADGIRSALFKKALALLCTHERGLAPEGQELQDAYIDALRKEVRAPGEGMSSGHVHASALSGTFHRLAWHLEEQGRSAEAVEVQREALRVTRQRLGPNSRETTQAATALAGGLRNLGKLEESESLHRWAHARLAETLGRGHRDALIALNSLGLALEARGSFAEAEPLFREAFEGLSKELGAEAPSTLAAAFNLASSLSSQALFRSAGAGGGGAEAFAMAAMGEAERLHHQALLGRSRVFGESSAQVVESKDALASLLVALGGRERAAEAEAIQREALEARGGEANGQGADDIAADRSAIQARSTLAQALRLQGRLSEAVKLFQSAYDLCLRSTKELGGGPDGPNTFAAASNLAAVLQDLGRLEEAEKHYRVSALGLRRVLGEDHPNTRGARANYERFLRETHSSRK